MEENIVEEIKKTEEEAANLIKDAKKKARSIIESATRKASEVVADVLRRKAVEEGRKKGEELFGEIVEKGGKDASDFKLQYKEKVKEVSDYILEEVLSSYGNK